jgi:hypoxanthine phosphoribosyltransferase
VKELGKILYKQSEIEYFVNKLACQLNKDYKKQTPVLVGVLNGSFIFMADLVRQLTFVHEVTFLKAVSYEANRSSGCVEVTKVFSLRPQSDVIIIEDIVDSGLTMQSLIKYTKEFGPRTVRVCTLLNRCKTFKADYIGAEVESTKFLVGYGLDLDNQFRNLPYIIECGG